MTRLYIPSSSGEVARYLVGLIRESVACWRASSHAVSVVCFFQTSLKLVYGKVSYSSITEFEYRQNMCWSDQRGNNVKLGRRAKPLWKWRPLLTVIAMMWPHPYLIIQVAAKKSARVFPSCSIGLTVLYFIVWWYPWLILNRFESWRFER